MQDWDAIAKKDNLNEMSTELRRLEAMVKEIHDEMLFLRTREEEMRDLNGGCTPESRSQESALGCIHGVVLASRKRRCGTFSVGARQNTGFDKSSIHECCGVAHPKQ